MEKTIRKNKKKVIAAVFDSELFIDPTTATPDEAASILDRTEKQIGKRLKLRYKPINEWMLPCMEEALMKEAIKNFGK